MFLEVIGPRSDWPIHTPTLTSQTTPVLRTLSSQERTCLPKPLTKMMQWASWVIKEFQPTCHSPNARCKTMQRIWTPLTSSTLRLQSILESQTSSTSAQTIGPEKITCLRMSLTIDASHLSISSLQTLPAAQESHTTRISLLQTP